MLVSFQTSGENVIFGIIAKLRTLWHSAIKV